MKIFNLVLYWINVIMLTIGVAWFCTSFMYMASYNEFLIRMGVGAALTVISAVNFCIFSHLYSSDVLNKA